MSCPPAYIQLFNSAAWGPPSSHSPSPKSLAQAGMTGARRWDPLGGTAPSSWRPPLTILDLLRTKGVASTTHSNVPSQKTPLCCWLVRGSLRYRASPSEQLFIERPAPLTHTPAGTTVIPSYKRASGQASSPDSLRPHHVSRSRCGCQSPGPPAVLAPLPPV